MTLYEKIATLKAESVALNDTLANARARIRYAIDTKKKAGLCGKCENGYIRRKFEIPGAIPTFLSAGYPVLCECIGVSDIETKTIELGESIARTESDITKYTRARARVAELLGDEYADDGLHNFDRSGNEAAIDELIEWNRRGRKNPLLIVGKTGIGKTHILAGIMNQFIIDGIDHYYIDGYSIDAMSMMEIYERNAKIRRMSSAGVLIIDDIGKSKMTDALLSHVYFPILHERRNNRRITIYTSDKMPRKIWQSFPDRENIEALYTRIEWIENNIPNITIIPLQSKGE